MASKGQKFNKYSNNLKEEVLDLYLNGTSSWYFERTYNIPYKTIQTWGRKVKHLELYPNQEIKKGRHKTDLTKEDWKEGYEILKNTRPSSRHNETESNFY